MSEIKGVNGCSTWHLREREVNSKRGWKMQYCLRHVESIFHSLSWEISKCCALSFVYVKCDRNSWVKEATWGRGSKPPTVSPRDCGYECHNFETEYVGWSHPRCERFWGHTLADIRPDKHQHVSTDITRHSCAYLRPHQAASTTVDLSPVYFLFL